LRREGVENMASKRDTYLVVEMCVELRWMEISRSVASTSSLRCVSRRSGRYTTDEKGYTYFVVEEERALYNGSKIRIVTRREGKGLVHTDRYFVAAACPHDGRIMVSKSGTYLVVEMCVEEERKVRLAIHR
jgi:hypothetical protein